MCQDVERRGDTWCQARKCLEGIWARGPPLSYVTVKALCRLVFSLTGAGLPVENHLLLDTDRRRTGEKDLPATHCSLCFFLASMRIVCCRIDNLWLSPDNSSETWHKDSET